MATILLSVEPVHPLGESCIGEKDAVAWMLPDRARESMALPRRRAIVISGPRMRALRQCAFAPRLASVRTTCRETTDGQHSRPPGFFESDGGARRRCRQQYIFMHRDRERRTDRGANNRQALDPRAGGFQLRPVPPAEADPWRLDRAGQMGHRFPPRAAQ